ncbi:MAG: SOS response-associated peptidase family protein [Hormoscilla sp. GM7CHS1pb]|nr:SOS response-associated peptidase family protein [Hormoscilla sp. GM7CHS1pb]
MYPRYRRAECHFSDSGVRSNHFSDSGVRSNRFSDSEVRSNRFRDSGALFAFAGLWDTWQSREGDKIVSCTILTTAANERVGHIHQRMPVIMSPAAYSQWLYPENKNIQELLPLFEQNANI